MWCLLVASALAAPPDLGREPDRVLSLGAHLAPLVGTDGGGGGLGQGTLMIHLPPLSIEILGGEGVVTHELRTVGFIGVGLRKHIVAGTWVRLLFAHHHETLWDDFLAHPGGVLAGVHSTVMHRSGLDVGFGWTRPIGPPRLDDRLRFDVGLSVRVLPGGHAVHAADAPLPPVYVGLQVGIVGLVGPRWQRKAPPPG